MVAAEDAAAGDDVAATTENPEAAAAAMSAAAAALGVISRTSVMQALALRLRDHKYDMTLLLPVKPCACLL